MPSVTILIAISFITTILLVAGCGQTGPLYLPEDKKPDEKIQPK